MTPDPMPIRMAAMGPTKPAAGVMATSPATAPEAAPRVVGLPRTIHSVPTHARVAAQVARCVDVKAEEARALAARALPALNPNHPNHSSPAPSTVMGRLWGIKVVWLP